MFHHAIHKLKSFYFLHFHVKKHPFANFYLYPTELGYIAHQEFVDLETAGGYDFVDYRRNHLSQENHKVLYENIKKMIKNDYEYIPFVKNINHSQNLGQFRNSKTGKFIYE